MCGLSFSERLLQWWDTHGRKDLPWQQPRTAYRVWVAEIMLQQTQVKTVIPYFNRFINRFADITTLAAATDDDVMAMWSGLGYYARARNLLKTAKLCLQNHAGEIPQNTQQLTKLPGIGGSTANAIYSQAFDRPAVVLDGNVKRVLTRHAVISGWPGKTDVHKKLWSLAKELLPEHRGADYTQAIMDLGATVCTRAKPNCTQCPVKLDCKAQLKDMVASFPAARPRIKITKIILYMLILTDDKGRVLLERRPPTGIWGGLWSLPADESNHSLAQRMQVSDQDLQTPAKLKHQLTHIHMTIHPLIGSAPGLPTGVECKSEQRWFAQHEWPSLGLPKPVRQLLETHTENRK